MKVLAGDKINIVQMMISGLDRVKNIAEKDENADYQHFCFSHNVFKNLPS